MVIKVSEWQNYFSYYLLVHAEVPQLLRHGQLELVEGGGCDVGLRGLRSTLLSLKLFYHHYYYLIYHESSSPEPVPGHDLGVGGLPAEVLHHVEVPLDHLDDGAPPAAGLLVTGARVNLTRRNVCTSRTRSF